MSEAWTSRSCKCDCEGGEAPTEFSTIGTGSMVRGVDCMPGTLTTIKYSFLSFLKICDSAPESQTYFLSHYLHRFLILSLIRPLSDPLMCLLMR